MATPDLLHVIALQCIPGIGDVLIRNLISYCGGAREIFHAKRSRLLQVPGIGEVLAGNILSFKDFARAEKELEFISKHQIQTYYYLEENYPYRLRDLPDAPCLLYGLGNLNLNPDRMVGIVGTRKASEYGRQFTSTLIEELKDQGITIVSGLALGIDGIAHKACVERDISTIGVLAHGLDRIYPSQHQGLAKRMLNGGGLLTEFPSRTNPDRENFPQRNRIVAGLSDVLVVVETGYKGGARITAEIAHSYDREIMALPGRVTDYYSQGCNWLIKENKAALISDASDLIALMGWDVKKNPGIQPDLFSKLSDEEQRITGYIRNKTRIGLDAMAFDLNMDPGALALKLLELEFGGLVRTLPGKLYEVA